MADLTMVRTSINGRWELLLPAHRAAQWAKWADTGWETERIASMHANLRPGATVYDIGAEEGDLPALWASWGCGVVCVEPNPRVWPNIRATFEANGLDDRLIGGFVGFAGAQPLWNKEWFDEHMRLGPWPACTTGPVIEDHGFLVLPERPDVPVTTIDVLAVQAGPPAAITIDVEGAELSVLRGAANVLTRYKPLVWLSVHTDLRWMDEKFPGDTFDAVDTFMRVGFGYDGHHLATDHELHMFYYPEGRDVVLS